METKEVADISLIICTYNWPEALDLCLRAVKNQTMMPREVIIADDGSSSETRRLIESYQANFPTQLIHVWQEDKGFRLAMIRNRAIKRANSPYIVQIDGDVIPERHFVEDHLSIAEKGCFIRGTRSRLTEDRSREILQSKQYQIRIFSSGIHNRFNALRIPFLSFLSVKKEKSGSKVKGCNMAFWKEDLEKVNGYNSDLEGWGHEDEDLCWRLVNNGILKKIVKLKAIVFHLHHKECSKENEQNHLDSLKRVKEEGITSATNGLNELTDDLS